ncbi:class I SAM-dependent methyltransferase [Roseiconus nitratireducens]|uniref:Class I SAM-dependent methyltransferase n=1 Tax=Roseiconus nitratireducens TaxID=2605748 RepID=A0A5M6DHG8_9BACT|nr:class I SAM-dependent methyltransferase [Roseiconus nitratireducens]KAA5546987.1 class I SAM-dependent methyltransferase [Roseiconus nitratireducens]
MPNPVDPFFEAYDREEFAYGDVPSAPLAAYLEQVAPPEGGRAIDLGAGAGRDTLALAKAGYDVVAVDLSPRGAERIDQRAREAGVASRVETVVENVCQYPLSTNAYDVICATTVLDHLTAEEARQLWQRMTAGLRQGGLLYVEVHTTEDPGSDQPPGNGSDAPVSETAAEVIHYFQPNQLARWASEEDARLRILRYEERLEWDYTHGPEHQHGKAILLAVRAGAHPPWYGQPAAFPRR